MIAATKIGLGTGRPRRLGLQLPREGFGAGKNFLSFKCLRGPLTGLLAPLHPRAMAVARAVAV